MFETHKLNDKGFAQMRQFKNAMASAVETALSGMGECRERSLFITKVEEAVFFGAKAIASLPQNHTEIIHYPTGDDSVSKGL